MENDLRFTSYFFVRFFFLLDRLSFLLLLFLSFSVISTAITYRNFYSFLKCIRFFHKIGWNQKIIRIFVYMRQCRNKSTHANVKTHDFNRFVFDSSKPPNRKREIQGFFICVFLLFIGVNYDMCLSTQWRRTKKKIRIDIVTII